MAADTRTAAVRRRSLDDARASPRTMMRDGTDDPDRLEPETKACHIGDEPWVAREGEQVVRAL